MLRNLGCFACLVLGAQGPASSRPPVMPLPAVPGSPVPKSQTPVKELVRVELPAGAVGTPESLVASLYAFISGPAEQKRQVERIRSLFHPQARILVAARHPEQGAFLRPLELESFLSFAVPQWEKGFFERATGDSVQKGDGLAQVWSPYEIRRSLAGPVVFTGVNAVQCAWDGKRWWITHLAFQNTLLPGRAESKPKP